MVDDTFAIYTRRWLASFEPVDATTLSASQLQTLEEVRETFPCEVKVGRFRGRIYAYLVAPESNTPVRVELS